MTNAQYEKEHLPFGITLLEEHQEVCAKCHRIFEPMKQGKLRMAEYFCSIDCADKVYPSLSVSA